MNDLLIISTFKHNYAYLKPYYNFYNKVWRPKKFIFYMGIYTDIMEHLTAINNVLGINLDIKNSKNMGNINEHIQDIKYIISENIHFVFYKTQEKYEDTYTGKWDNIKKELFSVNKYLNYLDCKYFFHTDNDDFYYVTNPELEILKPDINFHSLEFLPGDTLDLANKFNFISNHYYFRKKGLNEIVSKEVHSHSHCRKLFMYGDGPHSGVYCEICEAFDKKYEKNTYYKESYKNLNRVCFSFGVLSKKDFCNINFWDSSMKEPKITFNTKKEQLEQQFENNYRLSEMDIKNNVILNIDDMKDFFM